MVDTRRTRDMMLSALANVPAGRVVPLDVMARHLGVMRPAMLKLVADLSASDDATCAWHRIVAEGGAIGRHARRDVQIARLKSEGVPVSPAGIVDGFAGRAVRDLSVAAPPLPPAEVATGKPGRSRGMKERP